MTPRVLSSVNEAVIGHRVRRFLLNFGVKHGIFAQTTRHFLLGHPWWIFSPFFLPTKEPPQHERPYLVPH